MRANSLTNLGVSLDYNVASDYDKVLVLSGIASEIEELAPHANEIATIVANLPDVLTVQEASELVNNLTVKVTTLPEGSTATSELVGTEIRLGIPAGTQGAQGIQGPKGAKGDKGDIGLTGAKGPAGATGLQGLRGFRGEDGLDGEGVVITSILNNINKSLTLNFSDGTQHTTDPLKGQDGTSITVTNVVNNPNGTMMINFSDGTSHTTADLSGPRGFKGDTGDHVHHVSYVRSKDSLGNEIGPVTPSQRGYTDIYAMWASQEELPEMYIGEFTVYNGLDTLSAEDQYKFDSIEFGATADQEAFEVVYDSSVSGLVADNVQGAIDSLSATTVKTAEKGQPDGVASLDSNGLVPAGQLPSYVDDVLEVDTYAELPVEGESGKIYIVIDDETNEGGISSYRWTGTVYAMVSNALTAEDVKALYESNADTNVFTDTEKTKLASTEITSQLNTRDTNNRARANHTGTQTLDTITETTTKKIMTYVERTKLAGIEVGATGDQTATEIKSLYESNANTNVYTDTEKAKLSGVETGATADQTATEIATLYEGLSNTNKYTDAEKTKLTGIETGATADQTGAEIKALYEAQTGKVLDSVTRVGLNGTSDIGRLVWDADEQTADLKLNSDVTLQLGQEELALVKNSTGATIANGKVVMVVGSNGNSGNLLVSLHDGTKANAVPTLGITTQDIANGASGFVTKSGKVRSINTSGSAVGETWIDGDVLYVSTNGNLTKVVPGDTGLKMSIAVVINAHATNGTLFVRTNGLDENHDKDWTTTLVTTHTSNVSNPHAVTKAQVGLGNADNTSDVNKPVSTATQTALNLKANLASPTFTGTVSGISKSMVGLANVDNTSDALKPVSTAAQTALNLKANLASPTFTGTVSGITKAMVGLGSADNTADSAKVVASAAKLTTARTIGGVSFDGTANINLPGVNTAGTQSTTGNAATATKLQTARTINGVAFDGSANITVADSTKVAKTSDTGSAKLPVGTTAQRDAVPVEGMIRYNSTTLGFEGYSNGMWQPVGGGQMLGQSLIKAVSYNAQTISENIIVPAGLNAYSVGDVTLANGYTLTIENGSVYKIL